MLNDGDFFKFPYTMKLIKALKVNLELKCTHVLFRLNWKQYFKIDFTSISVISWLFFLMSTTMFAYFVQLNYRKYEWPTFRRGMINLTKRSLEVTSKYTEYNKHVIIN